MLPLRGRAGGRASHSCTRAACLPGLLVLRSWIPAAVTATI
jgi:hypothetical protein